MTVRARRRGAAAHGREERPHTAASTTEPADRLVALQGTAGNRAVASAIAVQRDGVPSPDAAHVTQPPLSLVPRPESFVPAPMPSKVRRAIEDWLDSHKLEISLRKDAGSVSMPEVVAQIRDEVAGAAAVDTFQVESLARQRLGHVAPPLTRGRHTPGGQTSELAARLKNLLGRKVEVGTDAANLVISVSGALGKVTLGGVEASVEAGTGGVGGKVKMGPGTLTASPDEFALKTSIPMGSGEGTFAAKLAKDGDTWSTWSASFSFPVVGRTIVDARPAVSAIGSSVQQAEQAIRDIAVHLGRGGSPTDDYVQSRIGQISPSISNVGSAVAEQEGPSVTVRIGASGGPTQVGGRTVREATVGVSVVIAF